MFAIVCITKRGSQLQVGWLPVLRRVVRLCGNRGMVNDSSLCLSVLLEPQSVCVKEKEKEKKETDDLFSSFCLIFLKEC